MSDEFRQRKSCPRCGSLQVEKRGLRSKSYYICLLCNEKVHPVLVNARVFRKANYCRGAI